MRSSRVVFKPSRNCKEVIGVNAARQFRNAARVLKMATVRALISNIEGKKVLEIGGGCLRNALYLQKLGFDVCVVELSGIEDRFPKEYERFRGSGGTVYHSIPSNQFDWAIATFVIETICCPTLRRSIIFTVHRQLRSNGFLILSVRGPRDHLTAIAKGEPVSDGYITPGKSFSRSYTPAQLKRFLRSCGFSEIDFLHKHSTNEPELVHLIAKKTS
jgi:hypothetical protein